MQLATNQVQFMSVKLNFANGFNVLTGQTFTCPTTGLYWLFYTVVWDGTTFANFSVQGTNQLPEPIIKRLHTEYDNYDTISRDKMLNLTLNQQLSVSSAYETYADVSVGSNWGAFLLDNIMSPLIAFEVYASQSAASLSNVFDKTVFNYGDAWSQSSQEFTAPMSGIYYFSLSVGLFANVEGWNTIAGYNTCELELFDMSHTGIDLISGSCMMYVQASQTVSIYWNSPTVTAGIDSSYFETSFRGFLYSPVHGMQVAWSVHNTDIVTGSGSAMLFPNVLVTIPSSIWQSSINTITIPVSGVYYMDLMGQTGTSFGTMDMSLTLNSTTVLSRLLFYSTFMYITRSQPVMAYLHANSILAVSYSNANLEGCCSNGLGFQGFLLYPD